MNVTVHRLLTCLLLAWAGIGGAAWANDSPLLATLRRPADLAWDAAAGRIWIVCRDSGTLVGFDPDGLEIIAESRLGESLVDIEPRPGVASQWLVVDAGANELLLLETSSDGPKVTKRIPVAAFPRHAAASSDGRLAYVTSHWSRQLTVVDLEAGKPVRTIALPFCVDEILVLPERDKLIVADTFQARLAVVDPGRGEVESVREFAGHNIGGLSLSRDGSLLYVVHQHLNPKSLADFDDVTWGILLFNGVRVLRLENVLNPAADILQDHRAISLGMPEDHAGDPGALVQDASGRMAVMFSGSGAVAVGTDRFDLKPVEVGRRPVAAVFEPGGERLFVVNQFSDTVSVIDADRKVLLREVSLGPTRDPNAVERGEVLFHDARLSLDRWMSCNSCHVEGHSVDQLVDTLGDGDYGAPKRILSLLGIADTAPFAWNGSMERLEDQIRKSALSTMHGGGLSGEQLRDLAAYLRSLSPPPVPQSTEVDDDALVAAGRVVFEAQGCGRCHVPPLYTSPETYDVGLQDEAGRREFNPPSLLGVSLRTRWLHDGRAERLQDVWEKHAHPSRLTITDAESRALAAFLDSLAGQSADPSSDRDP